MGMSRLLPAAAASVVLFAFALLASGDGDDLAWFPSIEAGLAESARTGKPVLVVFR